MGAHNGHCPRGRCGRLLRSITALVLLQCYTIDLGWAELAELSTIKDKLFASGKIERPRSCETEARTGVRTC